MNKETIKNLQESQDLQDRAAAELAIGMDIPFKKAQEILDRMVEEAKRKISLKEQFEVAMAAEFDC